MTSEVLEDSQKEACAVSSMRSMVEDICAETGMDTESIMSRFVSSPAYEALFDYDTGLWAEGPDYLREFFRVHG